MDEVDVAFDPTVHEAVEHLPVDRPADVDGADSTEAGDDSGRHDPVVTGVLRAGYRYKGRVVRPAMVQVRG